MEQLSYNCIPFYKLSLDQVYAIMKVRQEVFVVEQDCPYLDADGKDQAALHFFITDKEDDILGYTRLLPKGISYPNYSSIGRVVTSKKGRGKGIGKLLMQKSLEIILDKFEGDIKISAQCYLHQFYTDLGFKKIGEDYLEDNIPHQAMVYEKSPTG